MKKTFYFWILIAGMLTSCIKWGNGSKFIKFEDYQLVGDGNNNDSTFFEVEYFNKGNDSILEPLCSITIKDTTDKLIKKTLYSNSQEISFVPPHQSFYFYIYAEDFQLTSEVGKLKFILLWKNKKGKTSGVRKIIYP